MSDNTASNPNQDRLATTPDETDKPFVLTFDCGDGVPELATMPREIVERQARRPDDGLPTISARTFALVLTIFGQLLVALVVAAGGSALVGSIVAIALLLCGLTLALAQTLSEEPPDQRSLTNPVSSPRRPAKRVEV